MPLLSIIIPVYNAGNYLEACVDSVLAQEFADYELILVDDGSTDGSALLCDEYVRRDARIRVVHQENRGQAGARNKGLELAKGRYVGFCDNDDLLSPGIFRRLVENIIDTGADISAGSYCVKEPQGNYSHTRHSGEKFIFTNLEGMKEFLSREKVDIYVWTKIYARDFLERYHIRFEEGRNDEDFLFNHQAFFYAQKTVFTDEALYTYQVREDSECRQYYNKNLKRYLHNTLYRIYKIEEVTREKYPAYLLLARRQTILYQVMMIGRCIRCRYAECEPYFSYMLRYLRANCGQVRADKFYWGMSAAGVWLLLHLPPRAYHAYRRLLERIRKR